MTACQHCGIDDALGRHDPVCPHAIEIGLPRLAEGEDPIPPEEEAPELLDEPPGDDPGAIESPPFRGDHVAHQRPDGMWEARRRGEILDVGDAAELWISYGGDGEEFDAVIFTSELDALRHAVTEGRRVHKLELGRSLREQVS